MPGGRRVAGTENTVIRTGGVVSSGADTFVEFPVSYRAGAGFFRGKSCGGFRDGRGNSSNSAGVRVELGDFGGRKSAVVETDVIKRTRKKSVLIGGCGLVISRVDIIGSGVNWCVGPGGGCFKSTVDIDIDVVSVPGANAEVPCVVVNV